MYDFFDNDNKKIFENAMVSLKKMNRVYKQVQKREEFAIGRRVLTLKNAITSSKGRQYIKAIILGTMHADLNIKSSDVNVIQSQKPNYYSAHEFVVYTCIFGKYDFLNEPFFKPNNCKFYVITDQDISIDSIWEKKTVDDLIPDFYNMNNVQKNRYCKMHPHVIFPDVKYTIYIDGNVCPVTDLTEMVNLCTNHGMAFHLHRNRQCVYKEIEMCKLLGKANKGALKKYKNFLEEKNFPHNFGLLECNVIVRDNENEECKSIMDEWWEMFEKMEAKRDQLSIVYILREHGISPQEIATLGNNVYQNDAIQIISHI